MTSSFSNLSLAEPLARAVAEMGYESMTPIQAEAIPVVMTGQDVMGAAQTGTGKTAAFSLPLLHRLILAHNSANLKRWQRKNLQSTNRILQHTNRQVKKSFNSMK